MVMSHQHLVRLNFQLHQDDLKSTLPLWVCPIGCLPILTALPCQCLPHPQHLDEPKPFPHQPHIEGGQTQGAQPSPQQKLPGLSRESKAPEVLVWGGDLEMPTFGRIRAMWKEKIPRLLGRLWKERYIKFQGGGGGVN